MRIWIIDHYASEPKFNGISRQYDFALEFSKRGHDVTVISSSYSHFKHTYISKKDIYVSNINDHARFIYLRTSSYEKNNGIKRLLNTLSFAKSVILRKKFIKNRYGTPDVVVGCSVHPFSWIAAYNVSRKYNCPFIAEVRDLWPQSWIENYGQSKYLPSNIMWGIIEKWSFKHAAKIIYSMSKGDEYICGKLGFSKDKVIWIDQPLDCARFDSNAKKYELIPAEIKEHIGNDFLCVFTGYYMEYEGVFEMLSAAKIIQDQELPIKFVFVGSGESEKDMKNYVSKWNLRNTYVGGRIDKELIPALLRKADVCLAHLAIKGNPLSYKYDASKNKINEYMYANSCIIYGTYLKNHFVETSGAGILIEPFNAEAFADAIIKVFNEPECKREEYGRNAAFYIKNNNTVEKLVDRYETMLMDVINTHS